MVDFIFMDPSRAVRNADRKLPNEKLLPTVGSVAQDR